MTFEIRRIHRLAAGLIVSVAAPAIALAQSDVQPPQLVDLSFAPAIVDATAGPATVTVTLRVTDDLAGIEPNVGQMEVRLRSPSGGQFQGTCCPGSGFQLIAGGELDGTWEGTFDIPQFSEAGTWTVEFVFLRDDVGNTSFLDAAAVQALGLPTTIEVLSIQDTQAPQLVDMTLTPSIDVSTGPATATATLRITDDLTGMVPNVSQLEVRFRSPSGQQFRGACCPGSGFQLVAGNPLDGQWQAGIDFPQYSEAGTWNLEFLFMRDAVGNTDFLDQSEVQALGLPATIDVIAAVDDTSPPQLLDLSLTPILIDTTVGDQQVTVSARITDDLTGMVPNVGQFEVRYRSPSGQQFRGECCPGSGFQLISGDELDGNWEGSFTVPEFSEAGTWRLEFAFLRDAIGNTSFLDETDVQALGLPTTLIVVEPSLVVDGNVDPAAGGTVIDGTFGTARVTVPPGVLADATDIAIDVFESPLDVPIPVGFTSPGTHFVNIDLDPEPAYPLPAPGLTVTLPLSEFLAPGTSLDLFRIDPGTGQLVPALDVFGAPISGTVDPTGLFATFTGISRLSTIVALIPDQISVEIDIKPGGTPNSINPKSKGKIPVAILSTESFDAPTEVMIPLLRFGATGSEASLSHCGSAGEDVNGDGLLDLVCHFFTQIAGFAAGDVEGVLTGETVGGTPIEGRDAVRIVGKGGS